MHKIDGDGAVAGQFVSEDAASGRQPTQITEAWLNAVQGELVNVIEGLGGVLNKTQNNQLLTLWQQEKMLRTHSLAASLQAHLTTNLLILKHHYL